MHNLTRQEALMGLMHVPGYRANTSTLTESVNISAMSAVTDEGALLWLKGDNLAMQQFNFNFTVAAAATVPMTRLPRLTAWEAWRAKEDAKLLAEAVKAKAAKAEAKAFRKKILEERKAKAVLPVGDFVYKGTRVAEEKGLFKKPLDLVYYEAYLKNGEGRDVLFTVRRAEALLAWLNMEDEVKSREQGRLDAIAKRKANKARAKVKKANRLKKVEMSVISIAQMALAIKLDKKSDKPKLTKEAIKKTQVFKMKSKLKSTKGNPNRKAGVHTKGKQGQLSHCLNGYKGVIKSKVKGMRDLTQTQYTWKPVERVHTNNNRFDFDNYIYNYSPIYTEGVETIELDVQEWHLEEDHYYNIEVEEVLVTESSVIYNYYC